MNSKQLGDLGEKVASRYLENKGYRILDKNYSTNFNSGPKRGEIDIIARKDNVISFIEVKTLQQVQGEPFRPEDKVNWLKQKKLIKTAQFWLMAKKVPLDKKWQIDVVAIKIDSDNNLAKIQHFKNAVFS